MFPQQIETDRLTLRWQDDADAEEMFERYAQDPEVTRYLLWGPHESIDDTRKHLHDFLERRQNGESVAWLIRLCETGRLLGAIGVRIRGHKAEMGYCLARDAWGHGYCTEAARAVVAVFQQQPDTWRIEATCCVDNSASARVLEKAGFTYEGVLRRDTVFPNVGPEPRDAHSFSIVRDDQGNWS